MKLDEIDIDWIYLIERIETLIDLGEELLSRRLADVEPDPQALAQNVAFVWTREGGGGFLREVATPDIPPLDDLVGIERTIAMLRRNTLQFVHGYPANNVLLWGERGSGKSSSVKGLLAEFSALGLRLIEVRKEDLDQLPLILNPLRPLPYRFILFCDDLSFGANDIACRELKAVLEGGIEGRPENILVYATSNRRHLLSEHLRENCDDPEIHPEEAISEKLSLSDRFGLRLPFYPIDQQTYLDIVRHQLRRLGIKKQRQTIEGAALQWALHHGGRSGRVARQFVTDLAGRLALKERGRRERRERKN